MRRPPESLKQISAALSSSLSQARSLAEIQTALAECRKQDEQVATTSTLSPVVSDDVNQNATVAPIAIWEPTWRDGELFFVRPPDVDMWRFWADVDQLPPRRNGQRVVLLGESVARGFLLDPEFNVAKALTELLNFAGQKDVEVIDLARSAQTFAGLESLLQPTLALKPDAYVLFAGNNWHIPQPELIDIPKLLGALIDGQNWRSIKHYFEDVVHEQVTAFVRRLGKFSAQSSIPVIFTIPENDLKDWAPEYSWPNPLLTGELNLKRSQLIAEAGAALNNNEVEHALTCARELLAIEEGAHAAGLDLIAECFLRLSDHAKARELKTEVGNLALAYPSVQAAHCYGVIQNALRQEGPKCGITIVDVPQHFTELNPDALPDRHYFFDHVHMTVDGIRVAAAATVEKLLKLLGRPVVSWRDLNRVEFQVDSFTIALAHFGAACANGTQGQTKTLDYHCREAVRHDPRIREVMHAFLQIHRPNPIKYLKRFEDLLGREGFRYLKFLIRPFAHIRDRLVFPDLLRAVARALSREIEEELERQLRHEYGMSHEGIDLLRGPFVDLAHAPLESQWWDKTGYIRSYQREARFRIMHDQPCAARLRMTYRAGFEKTMEKTVRLSLNDQLVAELPSVTHWQTWEGEIPVHLAKPGINSLNITWSELCLTKAERVTELIKRLESVAAGANVKEVYLPYGEIYDIWVYPALPEECPGR